MGVVGVGVAGSLKSPFSQQLQGFRLNAEAVAANFHLTEGNMHLLENRRRNPYLSHCLPICSWARRNQRTVSRNLKRIEM
jgi:hypothetical protein